jgi:hypothetical protein
MMHWQSFCSFLGFSGRFCSYWPLNFTAVSDSYLPGFSGRSFSGIGNLKKLYGLQANCSGIDSGIFCLLYGNFLARS